jgi:formamidopyrimidine-DNA glycosylase
MPELPEVETTLRGIVPHLQGARIAGLTVREPRLRYPVEEGLAARLTGQRILGLRRRGKYLLLELETGTLLIHLGMSGSLRVLPADALPRPHDHLDLLLAGGRCLRLHDPRRFGSVLWTGAPPQEHPLLRHLGPEPLGPDFHGEHLYHLARARRVAVKAFLMDAEVVVGVGNIYANESLFAAGIHPARPCSRVGLERYRRLAECVRQILEGAIAMGGTTLRDYVRDDGGPGYFALSLAVYGRTGEACKRCASVIRQRRIGQRSSFYCPQCQR